MRTLLMAGAASLAVLALPANLYAQQAGAEATVAAEIELNAEQRASYDAWPPDRQFSYDAWSPEHQEYFWTLTPSQQEAYWLLNDEQRGQIATLTPEQQTQAWQSIESQLARADAAASAPNSPNASATAQAATSAARTAGAGEPRMVSNSVVQTTPGEPPSEYPICKGDSDDRCINAWAAGQRGPGVNRPLDHWPGRPASEMRDDRGG